MHYVKIYYVSSTWNLLLFNFIHCCILNFCTSPFTDKVNENARCFIIICLKNIIISLTRSFFFQYIWINIVFTCPSRGQNLFLIQMYVSFFFFCLLINFQCTLCLYCLEIIALLVHCLFGVMKQFLYFYTKYTVEYIQ